MVLLLLGSRSVLLEEVPIIKTSGDLRYLEQTNVGKQDVVYSRIKGTGSYGEVEFYWLLWFTQVLHGCCSAERIVLKNLLQQDLS